MDVSPQSIVAAEHIEGQYALPSSDHIGTTLAVSKRVEQNAPYSPFGPSGPIEVHYDRASGHLGLRHGTLDDATVGHLFGLSNVSTIDIVHVDVPSNCALAFARLLTALKVEKIDYIGCHGPNEETSKAIHALDAQLYLTMTLSCHPSNTMIVAPQLRRLDIGGTSLNTGDRYLFDDLRLHASKLSELICAPDSRDGSGQTLAHLRVERLTLVNGTFGQNGAYALEFNQHIVSLTLQAVPLCREWVKGMLRMSALKTLTITSPGCAWVPIGKTTPEPVIDAAWIENTLKPAARLAGIDVIFNA
jgi:hypothetical protein